jgi:hypothetical protein
MIHDLNIIDASNSLNTVHSNSTTTLNTLASTMASTLHNESSTIKDVLPSFHLHNFMLNRVLSSERTGFSPPDYEAMPPQPADIPVDVNADVFDSFDELHDMPAPRKLVLENVHKLQKINLPIKIEITLLDKKNSICNPLKQFLPGEAVHGFITFENQSTIDIPFDILLVSLEGQKGVREMRYGRWRKVKFLEAYDLHASYNFETSSCNIYDSKDDTYHGFLKRVLKPGFKVKKFFNFTIPETLLDDQCDHHIPGHLRMPTTYGVDTSAFDGAAAGIRMGSDGYGMLKAKGSPVKICDFRSQSFCNYYISVQIIGKNLKLYKPYYKDNTKSNYNYISIANQNHYFNVGRCTLLSYEDTTLHISTAEQLVKLTSQAVDALETIKERDMLSKAGLTSIDMQDRILYGSGKQKSRSSSFDSKSHVESMQSTFENYVHQLSLYMSSGLLRRAACRLDAVIEIDKDIAFQSYLPKAMDLLKQHSIFNGGINPRYKPRVKIKLKFRPDSPGKVKPPKEIKIAPCMKYCRFASLYGIPFTIDKDFLRKDVNAIEQELTKFRLYYNLINSPSDQYSNVVESSLFNALRGLAHCSYVESPLRSVFKHHVVNLENSWQLNKELGSYECILELPIEYDLEYHERHPHALLPPLQSCFEIYAYKLEIGLSFSNCSEKGVVTFPITVV